MDKSHKDNVKHKNLEIKQCMIPCISSKKDAKLIYGVRSQGNNFHLGVGGASDWKGHKVKFWIVVLNLGTGYTVCTVLENPLKSTW